MCGLLLLTLTASILAPAQDVAGKLVRGLQTDGSYARFAVAFPALAALPLRESELAIRIDNGGIVEYWYLRFLPGRDVTRVQRLIVYAPVDVAARDDMEPFFSATEYAATVANAEYLTWLEVFRLLETAVLRRRSAEQLVPAGQKPPRTPAAIPMEVRLGGTAVREWAGAFPDFTPDGTIEAEIKDSDRALLVWRSVENFNRLLDWKREKDHGPSLYAARRVVDAGVSPMSDVCCMVMAALGDPEDVAAISRLVPASRCASRASALLELLGEARRSPQGIVRLVGSIDSPDALLSEWARTRARSEFPWAYGLRLAKQFREAPDEKTRLELLRDPALLNYGGKEIEDLALGGSTASVRVGAARVLGRVSVLLEAARDKRLSEPATGSARIEAIFGLESTRAGTAEFQEACKLLEAMAADPADSLPARCAAAEVLGSLNCRTAVPTLLRLMGQGVDGGVGNPPSSPGPLRRAAVNSLGRMRVREGTGYLLTLLSHWRPDDFVEEVKLADAAGIALARIGEPSALATFEAYAAFNDEGSRGQWQERERSVRALNTRDADQLLEDPTGAGDAFVSRTLAELFSSEELEILVARYTDADGRCDSAVLEAVRLKAIGK